MQKEKSRSCEMCGNELPTDAFVALKQRYTCQNCGYKYYEGVENEEIPKIIKATLKRREFEKKYPTIKRGTLGKFLQKCFGGELVYEYGDLLNLRMDIQLYHVPEKPNIENLKTKIIRFYKRRGFEQDKSKEKLWFNSEEGYSQGVTIGLDNREGLRRILVSATTPEYNKMFNSENYLNFIFFK